MRASGTLRRYSKANLLRFLWTPTYAVEPPDRTTVTGHWRLFFRRLQRRFGRQPLAAVTETGSARGRLHGHFGASRFLSIEVVQSCWPWGRVHVGDPWRMPGKLESGELAAYLAKYVKKGFAGLPDDSPKHRAAGEHRYLVAQGFQPERVSGRAPSARRVLAGVMDVMGVPERVFAYGERGADPFYGYWASWPERAWLRRPR